MMKSSNKITKAILDQELTYDPIKGLFYKKHLSPNSNPNGLVGKPNSKGQIIIRVLGKFYIASRLAWIMSYNETLETADIISFKNGDSTDLRLDNLIKTNRSLLQTGKIRKVVRVNPDYRDKSFTAMIRIDGKKVFLGRFETGEEAIARQKDAAQELLETCSLTVSNKNGTKVHTI